MAKTITFSRRKIKSRKQSSKPKTSRSKSLDNSSSDNFQTKVYAACKLIPTGKVSTYKLIAVYIGSQNSYRAVGSALRRNPFAPEVLLLFLISYY